MSRIGKKPVALPDGVSASIEGTTMTVKGPKGTLSMPLMDDLVSYKVEDGQIAVQPLTQAQRNRAAWGMQRTNVQNLVTGVTEGFSKVLEITGVGYRANAQGRTLKLQLGFSHDVIYEPPQGISIAVPKPTEIVVTGINKQQVGQVAAEIREYRGPEPYKGKGVKYAEERIVRKEGKKK